MKHLIYIAGPMTCLPQYNYPAFDAMAKKLRAKGWTVINPTEIGALFGSASFINTHDTILHVVSEMELAAISACQAIFLLPGWELSDGSLRELRTAITHHLTIYQRIEDVRDYHG